MQFEIIPVLSIMEEIYRLPLNPDRFKKYIALLNGGDKNRLAVPVGGFNPMAKQAVLDTLLKMKALGAEEIAKQALSEINIKLNPTQKTFKVGLNIADDIGGSWSNKHQTAYESIFKFNGVFNYDFCTPYFWMSEEITETLIYERTKNYAWRTVFWLQNGKPKTLEDHLNQEEFVCKNTETSKTIMSSELENLKHFFDRNKQSTDSDLIFNFFFGDKASSEFGYSIFGVEEVTGFDLAKVIGDN